MFLFSLNRRGSVIVTFTITFPSSNQIINLTNAIKEGKIGNLSVSLVKLVNKMGKCIQHNCIPWFLQTAQLMETNQTTT